MLAHRWERKRQQRKFSWLQAAMHSCHALACSDAGGRVRWQGSLLQSVPWQPCYRLTQVTESRWRKRKGVSTCLSTKSWFSRTQSHKKTRDSRASLPGKPQFLMNYHSEQQKQRHRTYKGTKARAAYSELVGCWCVLGSWKAGSTECRGRHKLLSQAAAFKLLCNSSGYVSILSRPRPLASSSL